MSEPRIRNSDMVCASPRGPAFRPPPATFPGAKSVMRSNRPISIGAGTNRAKPRNSRFAGDGKTSGKAVDARVGVGGMVRPAVAGPAAIDGNGAQAVAGRVAARSQAHSGIVVKRGRQIPSAANEAHKPGRAGTERLEVHIGEIVVRPMEAAESEVRILKTSKLSQGGFIWQSRIPLRPGAQNVVAGRAGSY